MKSGKFRSIAVTTLLALGVLWCVPVFGADAPRTLKVHTKKPLVHWGFSDSAQVTQAGKKAAKAMLKYLQNRKDLESGTSALQQLEKLSPNENFGGDSTALIWFLKYMLGSKDVQAKYITNIFDQSYFDYWTASDNAALKEYLMRKYKLGELPDESQTEATNRRIFLEDFIVFSNPMRTQWEKSDEMVKALGIKPGDKVADIGTGTGYFAFTFADLVGDKGQVFAIDIVKEYLDYVKTVLDKNKTKNVTIVKPVNEHTVGVFDEKDRVDIAWSCNLFHYIYINYSESAIEEFMESVRGVLKKDGILYIADNDVTPDGILPFMGPYMDRNLIIGMFESYGFKFIKDYQFIPQRYILKFQKI